MKTKFLLFAFLSCVPFLCLATTFTVINSGNTFSSASITITQGDSVNFVIATAHNVVEVDQATYNAGGNTALAGGFSLPFGGGLLLPADLPVGTHYYVCSPHASVGMVGTITVDPISAGTDITHFELSAEDCRAFAKWNSQNESKVAYYQIHYSHDLSSDFLTSEKIYVDPKLNGEYDHSVDLVAGEYYFKLSSVLHDGTTEYTGIQRIAVVCQKTQDIIIHGTVSDGSVHVKNTQAGDMIQVVDMTGRLVRKVHASANITDFTLQDQISSLYFISIVREGVSIYTSPILME